MDQNLHLIDIEMRAALAGLDARQTQATPEGHPEKWSIQQIVEHLLLSYGASAGVVRERLLKRKPTKAIPTVQQRLGQWMLIGLGYFPAGRKSPASVTPSVPLVLQSGEELAGKVNRALEEFDGLTREGERVLGTGRAASHLVLGPLSMAQWRRFHLVHARHHLQQVGRIRRERGV